MDDKAKKDIEARAYLSARDLIEKKALIEKRKEKKIEMEIDGFGKMLFRVPTSMDIMDARSMYSGKYPDEMLIYSTAIEPNLRDGDLIEAFGCSGEPYRIVTEIFSGMPGAIAVISGKLVEAAGYREGLVKAVDVLKKG